MRRNSAMLTLATALATLAPIPALAARRPTLTAKPAAVRTATPAVRTATPARRVLRLGAAPGATSHATGSLSATLGIAPIEVPTPPGDARAPGLKGISLAATSNAGAVTSAPTSTTAAPANPAPSPTVAAPINTAANPTGSPTTTAPASPVTDTAAAPDLGGVGIQASWDPGLRPALHITWKGSLGDAKHIEYTIATSGYPSVSLTFPPASPAVFPAGIDPFVDHTITLKVAFFSGGSGQKSFPLAAAKLGPHPKNQDPAMPAGAKTFDQRPNPCVEFHWRYNPDREVIFSLPYIQKAFSDLSDINGIHYVYDGTTTDYNWVKSNQTPAPYDPNRRKWMLIQWEDPARPNSDTSDTTLGYSGPGQTILAPGLIEHFSDGADLTLKPTMAFTDSSTLLAALFHEFGHAHGLDHNDDPDSIMQPMSGSGLTRYGPIDIATLKALGMPGAGGCVG